MATHKRILGDGWTQLQSKLARPTYTWTGLGHEDK
jgi:hypothetical protein